jgi:hypothetical protein
MARLIVPIAALALGAGAAFALASCGGDNADLLPGETADQILANLDTVEALADAGDCEGARRAAAEVSSQVDDLSGVDRELVQALRRGTDRLETVVADCEQTIATTTEATTTTETTEGTSTERTGKTNPETTARTTTRSTTTATQTTPTTTPTQTTPTTTSPSGGTPPDSGGVTPGGAGGGQ